MSQNCLFCKIAAGEIPATIVFKDEQVTAFRDISPAAPTHILVIPNRHIDSLHAATGADQALLGYILLTAREIAEQEGLAASGYRVVLNTGPDGGQTVFHIHAHVLGGRRLSWPPG
jgi:histidine triad (HIT) family protein